MINSFENYLKQGKVKRKTKDPEEAASLLHKSKERLVYAKKRQINEKNAQFILEDTYEAAREAAQSLMSRAGFKPYSHEATISFIKKFHTSFKEEEIAAFDRFRQLRNDSVYRAALILKEDAWQCLHFSIEFIKRVERITRKAN